MRKVDFTVGCMCGNCTWRVGMYVCVGMGLFGNRLWLCREDLSSVLISRSMCLPMSIICFWVNERVGS